MPRSRPQSFNRQAAAACLPVRPRDFHKKKAVVLVVAGSSQYLGAALLCCRGAFRAGAGLVRLCLPSRLAPWAMAAFPELVVSGLGKSAALGPGEKAKILALAASSQAVAVGPGLGRARGTQALVRGLWSALPKPSVFDADALALLGPGLRAAHRAPRILTPHEGEAALLLGLRALSPGREAAAQRLAELSHGVAVLKGPESLVAQPQGRLSIQRGASPVLGSAGSGDVLAGCIASLLAQGASPFDAARLGVWAHASAGRLWARRHAGRGLLASDLAEALPDALALAGA